MNPAPPPSADPVRRILLVGFMGSGKSTVGPLVARGLGWVFVDADAEVERRAGRTIARIFAEEGEGAFRELERRVMADLLLREGAVIASGGGWPAANPQALSTLPPGTLSVWLRVDPEVAVDRARLEPGVRPLLTGDDPLAAARDLLRRRIPHYALSHRTLDTDAQSPQRLASALLRIVEERGAAGRGSS